MITKHIHIAILSAKVTHDKRIEQIFRQIYIILFRIVEYKTILAQKWMTLFRCNYIKVESLFGLRRYRICVMCKGCKDLLMKRCSKLICWLCRCFKNWKRTTNSELYVAVSNKGRYSHSYHSVWIQAWWNVQVSRVNLWVLLQMQICRLENFWGRTIVIS